MAAAKQIVLITGALHESAIERFRQDPLMEIRYFPDCSKDVLFAQVADCHALVTRSETDVDATLMDKAPHLKVIARAAVGVGNIDIDDATRRGILVINCPGKNTNSAAEMTMALLLGMLRHVPQAHAKVKEGGWDRHRYTGRELKGKSIGIVGLGNVGHRVAKFARGFDMNALAFDPYISPSVFELHGAKCISKFEELISQVDVLSFHVPLTKETKGMLTKDLMSKMKKGSWIVNAARGGVYREEDLIPHLKSGLIAGLAVDTFESEPKPSQSLVSLANVWVSPHIGASTEEAQVAIGQTVYDQVSKSIRGGVVDYPINLPKVGVITDPKVRAYATLAEKLGSLAGQILDFNPKSIDLKYRGSLANAEHALIKLSFMKGYASRISNDYVSFVNVETLFEKLGIQVSDREEPAFDSYRSALKITMNGPNGVNMTIGGIVFDDMIPKLSLINNFYFEVDPSGPMLLVENEDKPGVVGSIGVFLGDQGINIATFELSRNKTGGRAMSIIRVDQELTVDQIKQLSQIKNICSVHSVLL